MEFEQVVNTYLNSVYRAAYAVTGNLQDAEDITQETFLTYFNKMPSFDNENHRKAWLLRVAMNKGKNLMRSFWKRNRIAFDDVGEVFVEEKEKDEELIQAIQALPKRCRMIIHLHYYEDYPISDIAKILKINENTVKAQLFRGRQLLKERLKGESE